MKYSIIVPCYNEEKNLENLVHNILKLSDEDNIEIIMVENGSKDNSKVKFKEDIEGKFDKIKVVYVEENKGYGYGIISGIKVAEGDYVGWIHADLQVNPQVFFKCFEQIETSQEDVFIKGKRSNRHFLEYFFSYGMSIFETFLFKHKMYEVMAMPVIFPAKMLEGYMEKLPYDFTLDIFVYALANEKGITVKHVPVKMKDRELGASSWNTGITARIVLSKKMIKGSRIIKKQFSKRV